ncbi:MAG: CYTH domain-containing protein [Crocinitomicaceae bacterium]|jgi:adenylate cyclase|nr:CYTH domain-containing protein [Crocinitomicaceae bacterium]MDP4865590.1 CYTH domain-containing protein [Crocinitomicaceae bacterium]MDP5099005.1 CYTH domain-containing protein [Crocinitomicaceae bacterium]
MEIERKFLVDKLEWEKVTKPLPKRIVQAYILNSPEKTVRVRIKGSKGYLTIKGATVGISRSEFEYEIPLKEAQEMIDLFAEKTIEKMRYEIQVGKHLWEIDEFHGKLSGLLIAEIELESEDEAFEKPNWALEDVSTDINYFNAQLIERC